MGERHGELARIRLPEFGVPTSEPVVPGAVYRSRLEEARRRAAAAGLDVLIVYGDREHFANLAWLTAYDPRFEEALLVVVREPQWMERYRLAVGRTRQAPRVWFTTLADLEQHGVSGRIWKTVVHEEPSSLRDLASLPYGKEERTVQEAPFFSEL